MGVVVLFSGGLDSTTLAWDVVQHPYRYGLNPEDDVPIHLLTYATSEEDADKKQKDLASLVRDLGALDDSREVIHHVVVVPFPMESYTPEIPVPLASTRIFGPTPRQTGMTSDRRQGISSGYTPGLHLFLVSVAANLLSVPHLPFHGHSLILAGFQYEPEAWDWHDRGELSKSDTSPEWVEKVNGALRATSDHDRIRLVAPFLDNRLTKYDIMEFAYDIGVPVEDTSSCATGWMKSCGYCGPCVLRARTESARMAKAARDRAAVAAEVQVSYKDDTEEEQENE